MATLFKEMLLFIIRTWGVPDGEYLSFNLHCGKDSKVCD